MTTTTNTTAPRSTRPTGWIVATGVTAGLALAGMATAGILALHPAQHSAATHTNSHPAPHTLTPNTPAHHSVTPNTPTHNTPSASIKLLQTELGQLNYYEGPINGYDTAATIKAVTYLQRDAHLPQTGHLNAATERALVNKLVTGPNNMAN